MCETQSEIESETQSGIKSETQSGIESETESGTSYEIVWLPEAEIQLNIKVQTHTESSVSTMTSAKEGHSPSRLQFADCK